LQGAGLRLPLRKKNETEVVLAGRCGDEVLKSRLLARFLGACDEAVLMGATAGREVMAAISEDVGGNHVTRGVVFDAAASEMVDASLDWIMSYFARELRRENRILTESRFSAGYGDFLLENQGAMFRLLDLGRLDVQITESFVLIPEKSVTALAGVKGR
jgi:cobalamin-dependent methionine synthase I